MTEVRIPPHAFLDGNCTVYEHTLHIGHLARAAEIMADATPSLQLSGAPPIHYLLEMICDEIESLQQRVSD